MRKLAALILVSCGAWAQDTLPKAFTEPPTVRLGQYVLWHDPGAVETLDFRYGIGGPELAPEPPFTFREADRSGTTPKMRVRDGKGRDWVIKFGDEASPDAFCTRLAWAVGYYVEPSYFVADGTIQGVTGERPQEVDGSGHFQGGRFQLRSKEPKYLKSVNWSWTDNPFLGTPELNGLKVLMMLVSNWDDKDARDQERRGSNTAIYQRGELMYYFIDDWGGAMGHWGKYFTRSKWNASSFLKQSSNFVTIQDGGIHWGYTGQHSALMTKDLKFSDLAWLLQYLGRVTDDQLRAGLTASGATEEETRDYVQGLRMRIAQLQRVANPSSNAQE